jgi:hypothetical protein
MHDDSVPPPQPLERSPTPDELFIPIQVEEEDIDGSMPPLEGPLAADDGSAQSVPALCKFFMEGTCKKPVCTFTHPSHVTQLATLAPPLTGGSSTRAICKYFLTTAGCRAGSQCKLVHVVDGHGEGVIGNACCRDKAIRDKRRGKR